jgi:putative salt-induced outer membrane protein YdiY
VRARWTFSDRRRFADGQILFILRLAKPPRFGHLKAPLQIMNTRKTQWSAATVASCVALAGNLSAQAQGAAPAAEASKPKWETTAGVAFSLAQGNSDTMLFTANINTLRKFEKGDLRLGADAGYGDNNDVKSVDYEKAFGQYNHNFSERCYGYARVDAIHDDIADVNYRVIGNIGAGYYFIKNEKTKLSAEAGPGVVFEQQGYDKNEYMILRLAERFEHKFSDRARVWQTFEIFPQVDEFDNYIANFELGFEADLTKQLALRVVAQDNYDNDPAPGRKKNDFRLLSGIQYKF